MVMGIETELGIVGGWSPDKARAIQERVKLKCAHLPAMYNGVFLDNGARVYLDNGGQNEYCTPEVDDPLTLVRCEMAGRRLMQEAARDAGEVLLCSNVDYGTGNSWGTHENYECRAPLNGVANVTLLSHLATRIIYAGAGGPHPRVPGNSVVMSPRVADTRRAWNRQGVPIKSMVFRKPDNYGAGFRLHIICGESLLSRKASWLKYGTTALVAGCLDRGLLKPWSAALRNPLRTMNRVNRDLLFFARHELLTGGYRTAIEIQRHLADEVAIHRSDLPAWAGDVLNEWHAVLDGLSHRDANMTGAIDWLLYWKAWLTLAAERGFSSDDLRRLQREITLGKPVPSRYQELCLAAREMHVRLHALDDNPLRRRMAAAGWLAPSTEETSLEHAGIPTGGRAANRANLIRRFNGQGAFKVNWGSLLDTRSDFISDIPADGNWDGTLDWEPVVLRRSLPPRGPDDLRHLIELVRTHEPGRTFNATFRSGDYREALQRFQEEVQAGVPKSTLDWESCALSHARMGNVSGAAAALETRPTIAREPFPEIASRLFCAFQRGLTPNLDHCFPIIEAGEEILARPEPPDPYYLAAYNLSRGPVLLREGRIVAAIRLLRETLEFLQRDWRPRMLSRTSCFLADALRRNGEVAGARDQLVLSIRICLAERLTGDAVDYLFPVLVRLEEPALARELLEVAEAACRARENRLSLARILCLRSRIERRRDDYQELRHLQFEVEALRDCPLMERILENWGDWVDGGREGEEEYWGV